MTNSPWWIRLSSARAPDFIVGEPDNPYLRRWWLIPRNKLFNIYLHQFLRSDDDRALHDHPWFNLSLILETGYWEETIRAGGVKKRVWRKPGTWKFRSPWSAHRIELLPKAPATWTLFITGPVLRTWGFHCERGWRVWTEFVSTRPGGNAVGKGCED